MNRKIRRSEISQTTSLTLAEETDAVLTDLAFVLKMSRRVSAEIRREAAERDPNQHIVGHPDGGVRAPRMAFRPEFIAGI